MERDLAVSDHRGHDHSVRDHAPKVSVYMDSPATPLTTAAVKRHRFVQNLKNNHQKLIEALSCVERFAVVCELSQERLNAIRLAKEQAMDELTPRYEEKLHAYDARIQGGSS